MLIQEDADETAAEIMDELLTTVMDRCYEVDIERQIIPFTLFRIKSYLTQTVEQQMLFLDRGDEEGELAKTEDSEPMPATPDSWAQGCVPVVYAPHQPEQISLQLDPSSLPRHFILTEYEIVDNDILKDKPKKITGPLRPHPTLNKQGSECTVVSANPLTSSKDQPKQLQKRKDGNVCPSTHGKERHVSSGPLTPDTRVLEKAASLLDPTTAVIHPLTLDYRSQSKLKPVQSKPAVPLFSVDQVTAGPPPKVTPLFPPTNSDNYNA
ncbi:uncharacterized protein C2orf81 homolog [Cololabis saira]|uniref:uncharacterized protein C2orf81 homolog n=1 Tax=Cololabis saira TaxID=129043 RepID=UPI002AD54C0B|nr:uncharacterized protein C2orf81 homolog [Cololabis saira]